MIGTLFFVVFGQAAVDLNKILCLDTLGYCIRYPTDWGVSQDNDYTYIFSGPEGTPTFYTTVTVASFASSALGGRYANVVELIQAYKCDTVTRSAWACVDSTAYPEGDGYVAEFVYQGELFRQWRVARASSDGKILHSWAYTAPSELFATYKPIAEAMLQAWVVDGVPSSQGTATAANIVVIFETRDRIRRLSTCNSSSDLSLGRCHSITYTVNITQPGYVALSLVIERGPWVTAILYDSTGKRITFRPGNVADVYTSAYAVTPGTYTVKVAPELFNSESDFLLQVYFSTKKFTVDDLIALFGPRNRYLQR
ncbi:MAG: hypothetical protein NZ651_02190 [Candidatus Bipolaricaulota bacterium]|nr:hypothetical protein [Candidatus Bipolaricaulota bacterium]MDW8126567.1 hypothetical protein [Candidatus Bipolaricaulota bacterium]